MAVVLADADQPDVNAIHTASIKGGGGVVPKDGHESASAGSASESRFFFG